MSNRKLIVLLKNPVLGKVKTRLAKTIGDEKALKVYERLLEECSQVCSACQAKRFLFFTDQIDESSLWPNQTFEKFLQQGEGLGERLIHAGETAEKLSEGPVVFIGSDCYDLGAEHIEEAFEQLNHTDLVFGPANDGGYYLIGMKVFDPKLFKGIRWSTEHVLSETIEIAKQENKSILLLEELIDLDTFEDLKASQFPYPIK